MKIFFAILLLLISKVLFCQEINKAIYADYFKTADSIIELYYGKANKAKYLILDSTSSEFLTLHSHWGSRSYFNKPLFFKPNVFQFEYLFNHPAFVKDTFTISFKLDSSKQLMTGFFPIGLLNSSSLSNFQFINKMTALKIAKQFKIKKPLKNYEIIIGWEPVKGDIKKYRQTNDLRDFVDGRIVWKVKSVYRRPRPGDERYYAEIFVIDAMNGRLLSKEFPYVDWN